MRGSAGEARRAEEERPATAGGKRRRGRRRRMVAPQGGLLGACLLVIVNAPDLYSTRSTSPYLSNCRSSSRSLASYS